MTGTYKPGGTVTNSGPNLGFPAGAVAPGDTTGQSASQSGQYWDPSRNQYTTLVRPVPGMGVYAQTTGPNFAGADGLFGTTGNPNGMPYTQNFNTTLGGALNNLLAQGANSDPSDIEVTQKKLIAAGFLDPTKKGFNLGSISGTQDPTYHAFYDLLETSIRTNIDYNAILTDRIGRHAGKKYEDLLAKQEAKVKKAAAAQLRLTQPHTVNRTVTNLSDPTTAQGLLTTMLTNELGRNPTTDELSQFTSALNAAEAQNPKNTVATIDPSIDPYQDKTSVTTGGLDPGQFTQNYVNQNFAAEKNAVGGATGFYQAALSALGPLEGSFG